MKKKKQRMSLPFLIIVLAAFLAAFSQLDLKETLQDWIWERTERIQTVNVQTAYPQQEGNAVMTGEDAEGVLSVHYLDVGKCNCVLVRSGDGHDMMIDAGCNDDAHGEKILDYLRAEGVEKLDYLVLTHPHMDHIYAVWQILDAVEVEEVLMGDHDPDLVGTKIYQRVLASIEEKDPIVTRPSAGEVYELGSASFQILAHDDSPQTAQEELNECSIALMVTDGVHRFLFYGDGEEKTEKAMLDSGFDLRADVLMVSHHGSASSTGQKLVDAVKPGIAVIPCGLDLDGEMQEPSERVLNRLKDCGAQIYRSDQNKTVVIYSHEDGLYVECKLDNPSPKEYD